jgi:RimJ/RimL family protein N-acetyltransferase
MSDCNELYEWRSEPQTAQLQLSRNHFSFQEHRLWMKARLQLIASYPFFAYEHCGRVVVFTRSEQYRSGLSVSILVSPERRAEGFGTLALKDFIEFLLTNHSGIDIFAIIHSKNLISQKLFLHSGFRRGDYINSDFQEFLLPDK